jgi:endonuclease/exonuclease/phosphatase family metal-dependent hydrolase
MRNQFTVATFNLLNFIDANRLYYERETYSSSEYNAKCDWLADQFDRIDADVIAVQECWSETALRDAVNRSQRMRNATTVVVPGAQTGSDLPKVGLISHLPLLAPIQSFAHIPDALGIDLPGPVDKGLPVQARRHISFSRPVLKATLNLAQTGDAPAPLHLFNLHLKSKRPERYEVATAQGTQGEDIDDPKTQAIASLRSLIMRGLEAAAVRLLVLESLEKQAIPVIVTGDFNDSADAVTTEIIAGRAASHDRAARDYLLYNAALLEYRFKLHRAVGYSHVHQGDPGTLDHFLLSEEFLTDSQRCLYRLQRLDYFNDHLNDRIQTQSDHGIVRVQFVKTTT